MPRRFYDKDYRTMERRNLLANAAASTLSVIVGVPVQSMHPRPKLKFQRQSLYRVVYCSSAFVIAALCSCDGGTSTAASATPPNSASCGSTSTTATSTCAIFGRSVISRAYEGTSWTTADETAGSYAAALARVKPSYVSGLIYVNNSQSVTAQMISDYNTIRSAVLAVNPNAKFDVEVSLNPNPPSPNTPYANSAAVVAKMTTLDAQLHPDIWNFDFWSDAFNSDPDWVAAAVAYAHAHNQLVGGNVFGSVVPTGSDFVSFVDDPVSGTSTFGFDFSTTEIAALKMSSPTTILLGHLQSNAQNGSTTESCVYSTQWSESTQLAYLTHWASSQSSLGFTFIYPMFYPLCPGAVAFDPLLDPSPGGGTLYTGISTMMSKYNP